MAIGQKFQLHRAIRRFTDANTSEARIAAVCPASNRLILARIYAWKAFSALESVAGSTLV